MLLKRILLTIIAMAIGVAATYLIVLALGTTVSEFWAGPEEPVNIPYFILTSIFIALAAAIWLDKFMKTDILPK
jgi:hypothetical protein